MDQSPHRRPTRTLVFFPQGRSASHRRRRLTFLLIYLAVALMVIWPVYTRFAGIHPMVLGLPLSLAWLLLALAINFLALLWLFLGEEPAAQDADA